MKKPQYKGQWIRTEKRHAIYLRDGYKCLYCNKNLIDVHVQQRTLDHVIPLSKGGTNDPSNLVTCCKLCNNKKKTHGLEKIDSRIASQIKFQCSKDIEFYRIWGKLIAAKQITYQMGLESIKRLEAGL